jgi:hypothetical protein
VLRHGIFFQQNFRKGTNRENQLLSGAAATLKPPRATVTSEHDG